MPPIAGSVFRGRGGTSVQWELGPLTGELRKRKGKQGPPQLCCEETTPAEGGAPKCGQRSPGEGEDLDVKEREFPSGGMEDPNERGRVVWNCWVKRTDIDSVIYSQPDEENQSAYGEGD